MRNGQNVLVYAPRRYGKSSLVLRAAQEAKRRRVLVGYCDLMRTPTTIDAALLGNDHSISLIERGLTPHHVQ